MRGIVSALLASRRTRRLAIWIALIGAVLLFLLNLRRAGEQVGRTAERLQNMERTNDALQQMLEAGADRPRNRDDLADKLRDGRS
ncbi:MAG: hypothetical protein Q4G24_16265 [Paracoccus sp. (in: a-proteobacteria)]|uniref:hypothetical protein n=1 Tax=Paracoccus sp. TaxID=267 RepID=UPI0026E05AEE|nr:hypothetical protein [Paracoccus sp. (in: a-proteobacteria)]MDO5623001.1 hypothetical protein [Paracoccus sp. (in: a-proteobacteria)]